MHKFAKLLLCGIYSIFKDSKIPFLFSFSSLSASSLSSPPDDDAGSFPAAHLIVRIRRAGEEEEGRWNWLRRAPQSAGASAAARVAVRATRARMQGELSGLSGLRLSGLR